jgi:hypothetical protein
MWAVVFPVEDRFLLPVQPTVGFMCEETLSSDATRLCAEDKQALHCV